MRTIDFHAHLFTRDFFTALAAASPLPGKPEQLLQGVSERTGIELPDPDARLHGRRWLDEMERHGVEHLVGFASHPAEVEAVETILGSAHQRMSGMLMVDPTGEGAAQHVEAKLAEGRFRGVLTFPAMHHFDIGSPAAAELLTVLAHHRGICYVHCGLLVVKLRDLLGLPRGYDLRYANPLSLLPAADAYPEVTFVVPHFGAGFLRETLMLGAQCENVVVDTSSSNGWIRTHPNLTLREVFARALDLFGPQRVLFGTDSGTFPAGWRADRRAEQVAILSELGLSEGERAAILGDNAARILGLDSSPSS